MDSKAGVGVRGVRADEVQLTIANDLRKCLEAASALSFQASPAASVSQTAGSSTTLFGTQPPPSTQSSVTSSSQPVAKNQTQARKDGQMMQHAFQLSLKHQSEYMDDHAPLLGDPGSLLNSSMLSQHSHGSSTLQGVQGRGGTVTPTPSQGKGGLRTGTPVLDLKKAPALAANRKSVVGVGGSAKK